MRELLVWRGLVRRPDAVGAVGVTRELRAGGLLRILDRGARADVVGSLLRPPELLEARRRLAEGGLSAAEFKRVEDRAVDQAIALQERAGLSVVTDGEMRRESFQAQMVEAVEGFGERTNDAYLWGE